MSDKLLAGAVRAAKKVWGIRNNGNIFAQALLFQRESGLLELVEAAEAKVAEHDGPREGCCDLCNAIEAVKG